MSAYAYKDAGIAVPLISIEALSCTRSLPVPCTEFGHVPGCSSSCLPMFRPCLRQSTSALRSVILQTERPPFTLGVVVTTQVYFAKRMFMTYLTIFAVHYTNMKQPSTTGHGKGDMGGPRTMRAITAMKKAMRTVPAPQTVSAPHPRQSLPSVRNMGTARAETRRKQTFQTSGIWVVLKPTGFTPTEDSSLAVVAEVGKEAVYGHQEWPRSGFVATIQLASRVSPGSAPGFRSSSSLHCHPR
jgi:hypothetical protein